MPEKIVGVINIRGRPKDTQFIIKWLFVDNLEIVSGEVAIANCPILIQNFYKSLSRQ